MCESSQTKERRLHLDGVSGSRRAEVCRLKRAYSASDWPATLVARVEKPKAAGEVGADWLLERWHLANHGRWPDFLRNCASAVSKARMG